MYINVLIYIYIYIYIYVYIYIYIYINNKRKMGPKYRESQDIHFKQARKVMRNCIDEYIATDEYNVSSYYGKYWKVITIMKIGV